jgi:hypothetical protein
MNFIRINSSVLAGGFFIIVTRKIYQDYYIKLRMMVIWERY